MSSVQRAPEFPQADLQIMPDVAYPLMSGRTCPDITGYLAFHCWSVKAGSEGHYSGALYPDPPAGSMVPLGQTGPGGTTCMNFKASRSNAYFGSSSVTVHAAYCLIMIKT